ncbi:hypothetical protein AAG570_013608 [Ranatra chinensis]|uniref:FIT family protein n=1 Tax=Ranatra chinensis TaxID=642074 RepID=A0ABD0YCP0_9HEMI
MATKRKPLHPTPASTLNFRPTLANDRSEGGRGTKPTADPTSVSNALVHILQHVCKRILFVDIKKKLFVYFGCVFLLSLIADFTSVPKSYFSKKDNLFNLYFVKVAWGWTLLLSLPFVAFSSFTYCCGQRDKVLKHCSRLLIATIFWYFWTNLYNYFDNFYGRCNVKNPKYQKRSACLAEGFHWSSIDISGHCFILIYREEGYARSIDDKTSRPLRCLSSDDLDALRTYYIKFSPYIRGLFIAITFLTLLWDIMLLSTIIYFHNMLEKLIAYVVAVGTWALTYQIWYKIPGIIPPMPGEGVFKYQDSKPAKEVKLKPRPSLSNRIPGPKFMGMPLKVPPSAQNNTSSNDQEQSNNVL